MSVSVTNKQTMSVYSVNISEKQINKNVKISFKQTNNVCFSVSIRFKQTDNVSVSVIVIQSQHSVSKSLSNKQIMSVLVSISLSNKQTMSISVSISASNKQTQ